MYPELTDSEAITVVAAVSACFSKTKRKEEAA